MALFLAVCICALFTNINAGVSLEPSGSVSACANGSEILVTCVTEGSLVWRTATGTQLFSGQQAPIVEGRFNLTVNSANSIAGVLRLNSTARLSNFQPEKDNGISIACREFNTGKEKDAVFRFTGGPMVTLSEFNSTSSLISWNPSTCVQYVVTIINSSDGSVYLNITTSDTNTTVTLPTGVEYCVTVLGVDSIGRRGPPSQQQHYMFSVTPSSSNTATSPSSTPSVNPTTSVDVAGGVIAGVVIAVIVIILAVIATVVVVVIVYNCNKGPGRTHKYDNTNEEYQCVYYTFLKNVALNSWEIKFVFVSSKSNLEALDILKNKDFEDFEKYGSPVNCYLKSSDTIQVKVTNKPDGWTVDTSDYKVHKATIEGYTGDGSPPHIEMMITADSDNTTPPDLTVEAKLKGVNEPNIIKFEKEARNVVECVYQVFYHKIALNHWRARVAFFSKQYLEIVNKLYQDANNCPHFIIKFGGGMIKVSTDDTVIPAGWEVAINQQYQQVTTAAVEQYTGEGEPRYCEMTLRATDIAKSYDPLQLLVTLIGVREKSHNTFYVERVLEKSDGVILIKFLPSLDNANSSFVCQVFYHKLEGINHWKVTLAFFTENKTNRVKQFYQDANLGQTIRIVKFSKIENILEGIFAETDVIEPDITTVGDGWNMTHKEFIRVKRKTIVGYNGVDKPHCCVMIFKAVPGLSTPPDLTATIIIGERKQPTNMFFISRVAAETQSEQQVGLAKSPNSDSTMTDLQRQKLAVTTAEEDIDGLDHSNYAVKTTQL